VIDAPVTRGDLYRAFLVQAAVLVAAVIAIVRLLG